MSLQFQLKPKVSQKLKIGPTLRYSVSGAAFASVLCVAIFLCANLGSSKNAVANTKPASSLHIAK
jgi:hypothetical protein